MRAVHVVEELGRQFCDFGVVGRVTAVEVVEKQADEVAERAVEAVFDFVLSAEWQGGYRPMARWTRHQRVPNWLWI